MSDLQDILGNWTRLGAMFNVPAAAATPDLEALLIDSSSRIAEFARLQPMMISWLLRYEKLVCRHRLAAMASQIDSAFHSAALGYTLAMAAEHGGGSHLNVAIRACPPLTEPEPLFDAYRSSPALTDLARESASILAKKWGFWASPDRLYDDAIRPTSWVMSRNPALHVRAVFGGKLPASIIATLTAAPEAGASESALARACAVTRVAVRDALDHLELCQYTSRVRNGREMSVRLTPL